MRTISLVLLAVITVAAWSWSTPRQAEGVGQTVIFPLSVSGKVTQTDIAIGPGFKPKPQKANDKIIGAILRGENTSDYSVDFLDLLNSDGSGRFYLYFDGRGADGSTSMRVATNGNGAMATTLEGAITQDGVFWIAGKYSAPVVGTIADAFATGKVKFAKGTFTPLKISGTVHFVSATIGEGFTLKFKTLAQVN
ncbi:MAG: hypothetical protein ABIR79_01320 [Candidatus Binatia bacterium]